MRSAKASKTAESRNSQPDDRGKLKDLGGSKSDQWNLRIAAQALDTMWLEGVDAEQLANYQQATFAALRGIAPRDEVEGMIAAQMIGAQNAAMECYRRAMIPDQSSEARRENLAQAGKLSRTYAALVEALNRHRGKGQQKVTVEHFHVHSGGQAIVGNVATSPQTGGGGGDGIIEDQHHAKQIAHEPQPALPCKDTEGDTVPVTRNAERAVPNARRKLSRRPKRE